MKRAIVAAVVLLVLATPLLALAFEPRAGRSVTFSVQLQDDLYIASGTVDVTREC